MSADLVRALAEMNLAASAAIALVLLVRSPAHGVFGPRAVYLMWAIVPAAMLATIIPERTVEVVETFNPDRVVVKAIIPREGIDWEGTGLMALLIIWAAGAVVLAAGFVRKQAQFYREANRGEAGPAVAGFSYPQIVTPKDFAQRFNYDERRLILTHEEIHLERNDPRINALVALVRCVCWFNPLVHIGAKGLHADQELSCDALVVERRPKTRRIYAQTLLKTQLAANALPVGCYWPPRGLHPLKERIAMLARAPLSHGRRVVATSVVLVLAASGGVATWAAQPERKIFLEGVDIFIPFHPIPRADVDTTLSDGRTRQIREPTHEAAMTLPP